MVSHWLSTLEQRLADGDLEDLAVALVSIAYVAGAEIEIPEAERRRLLAARCSCLPRAATRREGSTSRAAP